MSSTSHTNWEKQTRTEVKLDTVFKKMDTVRRFYKIKSGNSVSFNGTTEYSMVIRYTAKNKSYFLYYNIIFIILLLNLENIFAFSSYVLMYT